MTEVGVSILSADFSNLRPYIKKCEKVIDFIHMDIMDGNFVPNLTFGTPVINSLRKITKLPFEAHLMVINPQIQWKWYLSSRRILFHIETVKEPEKLISHIKKAKKEVGIALNPETSIKKIIPFLDRIDVAFLMGVSPGFAGQKFKRNVLKKIKNLRRIIDAKNLNCKISVDGGINHKTAPLCIKAGADILIASSFLAKDIAKRVRFLKNIKK